MQVVNQKQPQKRPAVFTALSSLAAIVVFILIAYHLLFWGRIYPGVKISNFDLGGKTIKQATAELKNVKTGRIVLALEDQGFVFDQESFLIEYLPEESARRAYQTGRDYPVLKALLKKLQLLKEGEIVPFSYTLDQDLLDAAVAGVSSQIDVEAVEPTVSIQNSKVLVNPGKNGQTVNKEELKKKILESVGFARQEPVSIPTEKVFPQLTEEETEMLRQRAEKLVGKKIQIKFEYDVFSYPDSELVSLLTLDGFDRGKIASLAASIAKGVERPPQNARFLFEEGRVKEFAPAKVGVTVKQIETEGDIENKLERLLNTEGKTASIDLPIVTTLPTLLTQDVNLLGIKELIGRGTSLFRGSIPGRVHNIVLAASKINGLLIKPEETFSFNEALGDVSIYTGYQQAYVIKNGRTVLGDGGGVCQVSTTFFRAALNTGLPIIERHAHSYRVGYYEQDSKPGIDATVYAPSVDLEVKNDTPSYILIQAKADTQNKSLVVELYGTSDGRVAEATKPQVWDIKPAPPPLYQDDPMLPAGAVRQVDFAASGAKTSFDYKVTRNGEVLQNRTFASIYRPWQAVYLRGTATQ